MRELYDLMMEAYHAGDDGLFEARARNWIVNAETAFFNDSEADEWFAQAKMYCRIWQSNQINSRSSRVKMMKYAHMIAEKDLPNPYPEEVVVEETPEEIMEEVPEIPEIVKEVPEVTSTEEVTTAETVNTNHVLGVVPEEPKHFFTKRKKR